MFNNHHYLTKRVQAEIPLELQLFMWGCVDRMPEPKDYFQVFRLEIFNGIHTLFQTPGIPQGISYSGRQTHNSKGLHH